MENSGLGSCCAEPATNGSAIVAAHKHHDVTDPVDPVAVDLKLMDEPQVQRKNNKKNDNSNRVEVSPSIAAVLSEAVRGGLQYT